MSRTITILKDSVAIDDDKVSGDLVLHKGQEFEIEKTLDRGEYWLIKLAYEAGDWLFKKTDISFSNNAPITKEQLEAIFGKKVSDALYNDFVNCLHTFDITTPARIRHFTSQVGWESGGGTWTKEIASGSAYEGRRDLGNIQPGDGRRFKGGGLCQITGRANYQAFANYMKDQRIMEGVDYVASVYPASSAGWYWMSRNLNSLCDKGATVEQITRIINGGQNGIAGRKQLYNKALQIIK